MKLSLHSILILQLSLAVTHLRDIADRAGTSIYRNRRHFLLFNHGSSDDLGMCFPPFKRKNRISILLHDESEKWASISSLFQTSGFQAQRINNLAKLPSTRKQYRIFGPDLNYLEVMRLSYELTGLGNKLRRAATATQEFWSQNSKKAPSFYSGFFLKIEGMGASTDGHVVEKKG
jgi:hypothetical protein